MFGLFGKSDFESENNKLENEHKALGAQLLKSMQQINISEQIRIMESMLNLYARRIECCKKYGKTDLVLKLELEREQLQRLHG